MTKTRILILALVLLAFLTLACSDWDIDRTSDEYTGVQTRQAEGLPLDTPTPKPQEAQSW